LIAVDLTAYLVTATGLLTKIGLYSFGTTFNGIKVSFPIFKTLIFSSVVLGLMKVLF